MRATFTLFFSFLLCTVAWAQPANDDCDGAINLTLSTPSCNSVTNNFNYNNTLATPSSPFPAFTGCNVGGSTDAIGADVWFSFTATGTSVSITLSGLSGANIVLFDGDNGCAFLVARGCANGTGSVTLDAATITGNNYFIVVYGNGVADQGNFSLSISSIQDCSTCYTSDNIELIALTPPTNGTYSSGQQVSFCLNINLWETTTTVEWLHAVEIDFGPGWDYPGSFIPQPPPSCDGFGSWNWYFTPWTGCNTGMQYGPGFAYDSSQGVGCGGAPNDGNPGNNWGDGANGCADIGISSPPVQFCWSISVNNCPPNTNGDDLGIDVSIYSDGDSGSWNQTGCNTGESFDIIATGTCCNDFDPLANPFPTSCPGQNDGYIQIQGGGGIDPFTLYNITVFDGGGNLVYSCMACSGTVETDHNLLPGSYNVLATNIATNCNRSTTVVVAEGMQPTGIASVSNMPCPGDPAFLMGDVSPFDPFTTYTWSWTGPNGFTSFMQNPTATEPGTYTLTVSANGCDALPVDVLVEYVIVDAQAFANPNPVCQGSPVELTATGGVSYDWENITTNQPVDPGSPTFAIVTQPTTFRVTATDANGCTGTAEVFVDAIVLPFITVDVFPANPCTDDVISLTASGAGAGGMYFWPALGATINPLIFDPGDLPAGTHTFDVEGTDASGCVGMGSVTFTIGATPDAQVVAQDPVICAGQSTLLTASGGPDYFWSTGPADDLMQSIVVAPTTTTTYMVTVTAPGSANCTDVAEVTVTVEDAIPAPMISCGAITPNSVEFVWNAVPGAVDYTVTSSTMHSGTLSGTTYTVTGLAPGETVTITVSANGAGACPPSPATFSCTSQNCPAVTIIIDPVNDVCRDASTTNINLNASISSSGGTTVWSGTGVIDANAGIFDPFQANPGANVITVTYTEGQCSYAEDIMINVNDTPTADFGVNPGVICADASVTVTYAGTAAANATYNWDFAGGTANPGTGVGPHTVSWNTAGNKTISLEVIENGCTSPTVTQTVEVDEILVDPDISCGTLTTNSVSFVWDPVPGALDYSVSVMGSQTGTLSGTTFTVNGLAPGETVTITVTATSSGSCPSTSATFSCQAQDCSAVSIDIDAVADICRDNNTSTISLNATISSSGGTSVWSGPGITDAANGIFDPAVANVGANVVTLTYTEGQCVYSEDLTINVFAIPSADFTVDADMVCEGEIVNIMYTGTAGAGTTYTWDFAGGTANPGSGVGPHTVSWNTPGTKTISLQVSENGCSSTSVTQTVQVDAILAAPDVSCGTITTNSVSFNWDAVTGAQDYTVNVTTGQTGTLSGTSFTVSGLAPGEQVTIEVTANSAGSCPATSTTFSCQSQDCPTVNIDIDAVADICRDNSTSTISLSATISSSGGSSMWSGPGITDAANGIFDPAVANVGANLVTLTYTEGQCVYSEDITINVFAIPSADFTVDANTVCEGEIVNVMYTGTAGAGATYTWDFAGGSASPGNGVGPHTVSWDTPGTKTINLQVSENGCTSTSVTQTVNVQSPLVPPTISCGTATTTRVVFSWDDVVGATSYDVNVTSGQGPGTLSGTTYTVDNLVPGTAVDIELTVNTDNVCGPLTVTATCTAESCPVFIINIDPVADFCSDDDIQNPIDLNATVTGGTGSGTLSWSGPGVSGSAYDPVVAGVGLHTLTATYTEGPCTDMESIMVNVFATPQADFTVSNDPLCINQETTINFTGSAGPTATFDWNFGGGVVVSGTDAGPYQISWPTQGPKTVTLNVTENGCPAESSSQTLMVEAPLAAPLINCQPTPNSVTFSWNDVAGAVDYTVNVIQGPAGTLMGNSYEVTGLSAGDIVEIEVTAVGNGPCGNSMASLQCVAEDCPDVVLTIAAVPDICFDNNAGIQNLTAQISGGAGGGTESWSGPGVTDNDPGSGGMFDPQVAGVGVHTINLNYQEGNCGYNASVSVNVYEIPTTDFTISPSTVCVDQATTITYTGTAADTASFDWDFGGGTVISGSGAGPYEVSWPTAGSSMVSLSVTQNNCTSTTEMQSLDVTAPLLSPVITCMTTNTSISFSWNDVAGATNYTVEVLSGATGTQTGNSYLVDNLLPGDEVTIRVTAQTDNPCGPSSAEATCIASDCLMGSWDIPSVGPLCTGDMAVPITGTLTIDGMSFTDGFTLSGPGAQMDGTFDPAAAGVGTHTVCLNFTQGVCDYQDCIDIEVNPPPTATFDGSASVVCVDEVLTLSYTGNASANATYEWDFAGGMANPTTGQGPIAISWPTAGPKEVTLTVTVNGCVSDEASYMLMVEEPLAPLVVSCQGASPTSVVFGWNDIPGATAYTVTVIDGPSGTMSGNTYTITGLSPNQSAEIMVTAQTDNVCGPVSGSGTCTAQPCQDVSLSLSGSTEVCAGDEASIIFDFTGTPVGPFLVTYLLNGGPEQNITLADGESLNLAAVTEDVSLSIVSIQDTNLPECTYTSPATWSVMATQPPNAGISLASFTACEGSVNTVNLADLLDGQEPGGVWTESSDQPSTGGAFNAVAGTFQTDNQTAGVYTFDYTVSNAVCPAETATVTVELFALPVADAGVSQTLTCTMGMVVLGGEGTSVGATTFYEWTADDPNIIINNPTDGFIEVSQAGTYTLTVRNGSGCVASSSVVVTAATDTPVAAINLSGISCFQANDGAIIIESVAGGEPPYSYSLNDEPFSSSTFYGSLGPGEYNVVVRDANGCFTEVFLNLTQPNEVVVTLTTNIEDGGPATAGIPVTLTANYDQNLNIDTIIWRPDSLGNTDVVQVTPTETTAFGVTIIDANGCSDSDNINLIVEKTRPVFIANAISPDGDGTNDILFIQADARVVEEIESFMVFNRWGESVWAAPTGFQPNNPDQYGWDGRHRQQVVNAGVYVYYARIRFTDGDVVDYKGDVIVVR